MARADSGLVGDLQPSEVTVARDVEHRPPGEGARALGGEVRAGVGECEQQGGIVGLCPAGREMSRGGLGKAETAGHGADHVRLDFHRRRRRGEGGELRVEDRGNAVRTLGGEGRGGIEQAEVPGVRDMHEPMLHLPDRPLQCVGQRTRGGEIERLELGTERRKVEVRHDAALRHARARSAEPLAQRRLDTLPKRFGGEQGFGRAPLRNSGFRHARALPRRIVRRAG